MLQTLCYISVRKFRTLHLASLCFVKCFSEQSCKAEFNFLLYNNFLYNAHAVACSLNDKQALLSTCADLHCA